MARCRIFFCELWGRNAVEDRFRNGDFDGMSLEEIKADSEVQEFVGMIRKNGVADESGSYSITDIKGNNGDYGIGVYLDTDKFDNVKPRYWNKIVSDFVYNNLEGKSINVVDDNGNVERISFAKRNERVQKDGAKNDHKVIDKLARTSGNTNSLAVVHIDEILKTAKKKMTVVIIYING